METTTLPTQMPTSREDLQAELQETGLPEGVIRHLAAQAKPTLLLETQPTIESAIPLGANKLGGMPDLPPGMSWPFRPPYAHGAEEAELYRENAASILEIPTLPDSWMTPEEARRQSDDELHRADILESEYPLSFIVQLDLRTLATESGFDPVFPDHGRLLFFYDLLGTPPASYPSSAVGWRLIWDQTPAESLVRTPQPAPLSDSDDFAFGPAAITPLSVFTSVPLNDESWDAFPVVEGDDEACDAYDDWLGEYHWINDATNISHQLGGWPAPVQYFMQTECQLAFHGIYPVSEDPAAPDLLKHAKDWRLVLQIGPDATNLPLADGCLYVLMRDQDIRARAFDRAWVVYQCD